MGIVVRAEVRRTLRDVALTTAMLALAVAASSCDPPGTYPVTSTSDGAGGSLRVAISAANASEQSSVRIELPPGEYRLTRCGSDDTNGRGDLDWTTEKSLTIAATGSGVVIRQTCAGERVLHGVGTGPITLQGVRITGGSVVSTDPARPAQGGGIRARGSLTLDAAIIAENSATGAPGRSARAGGNPVPGGAAQGGGLFVEGSLSATSSSLFANTASGGSGSEAPADDGVASSGGDADGGGAYVAGIVNFERGTIAENRAVGGPGGPGALHPGGGGSARGGGIAQSAASTLLVGLSTVTLAANSALGGASGAGGGFSFTSSAQPAGDAIGGGVAAHTLAANALTASQNTAIGGSTGLGGCPAETECTTSARAGSARGGALAALARSVLAGTFSENRAVSGDGFATCVGRACSPLGVPAALAEGGAVWSAADLWLRDASFSENTVTQGDGLFTPDGPTRGGAVAGGAALDIEGGLFTGNSAVRGEGGAVSAADASIRDATFTSNTADGSGGAIQARGLTAFEVNATLNKAGGSGGGAIAVTGDARLQACRIRQNSVDSRAGSAGGGGVLVQGALLLSNSDVSDNRGRTQRSLGMLGTIDATFAGGGVQATTLVAQDSTLAGNEAFGLSSNGSAPPVLAGQTGGGGIAANAATLLNVTLSDNRVTEPTPRPVHPSLIPNAGAAVLAERLELDHATIADNAGAQSLAVAALTAQRSVAIAPAEQTVCGAALPTTAGTYNHFSDASCALDGATNQQAPAAFLLGPVTDNGGFVPTRRPAYASVLVDRVPASACPIPTDARGVTRPQGTACDIGAVEAEMLLGTGTADWSITFSDPPPSVTPGEAGAWTLTVRNHGPSSSAPAVRIDVPAGVQLSSASATGGAACSTSNRSECVWSAAIAPGAHAIITLVGRVDASVTVPLSWRAEVFARNPIAPFENDVAELKTPLAPRTGITLSTTWAREFDSPGHQLTAIVVELRNAGPSTAIGTAEQPIGVIFNAAPGVRLASVPEGVVGSFAPSDTPFASFWIGVSVEGPVPAQLGTVDLLPGSNPQSSVPPVPVFAADLELRAFRTPGARQIGEAIQYRLEVHNHGAATANDVTVSIQSAIDVENQWAPSAGTLSGTTSSPTWVIPALAPGQTASLGSDAVASASEFAVTSAMVTSRAVDLNPENDAISIRVDAAPRGTADLQLSTLQAYRGAADNQRVLRATLTNAGPAVARASVEAPMYVALTQFIDAHPVSARALSSGWTCQFEIWTASCTSARSLAVGASVSFEFVLEGTFPDSLPRLGATAGSSTLTPDHAPNNNTRYVNAAAGM